MSKDEDIQLPKMADVIEVLPDMIESLEEGDESVDEGAQHRNLMSILKDLSVKQQRQSATKRKANRAKSANAKVANFMRDNVAQIQQLTARKEAERKVLLARAAKIQERFLQHEIAHSTSFLSIYINVFCITRKKLARSKVPYALQKRVGRTAIRSLISKRRWSEERSGQGSAVRRTHGAAIQEEVQRTLPIYHDWLGC